MNKEPRGLLTPSEERWLARFMDRATPFKRKLAEKCDYFFYLTVIRLLDNVIIEKTIPENWENPLRKIIGFAKAKDVKSLGEFVSNTIAGYIDIPFLNETGERAIFFHAYGLIEASLYDGLLKVETMNNSK